MTQEVNIKLRADTREAVKSVKDLEREVANIENVRRKGDADKGFLSEDDVKRFRRMSEDALKVYQRFAEQFNRLKRELDKSKEQLADAIQSGAGQSTIAQLQNQVNNLQSRHNIYQSQVPHMTQLHEQSQATQQAINSMNTPGAMSNILMMAKRLLPMLGLTLGAGAVIGFAKQGMNQIKVDEAYMSKMGQRVSGFNGDFEKGRKEAEATGLKGGNAYKALDTMQTAENWASQAGAKNNKQLWQATNELQTTGRVMGLDPSELASQMGSLSKMGALDYKSIKSFREGMVGAIKETGMAGRDREFVQAVTGLSQQVGRGQMNFSNGELNQVMGLETILSKAGKGLQGEKGAEVLSAIDNGVKGNDSSIDVMLGWGTKFQGPKGRAQLERMKAGGIGDPALMKELFTNIDSLYGGDKDQQALWLKDKFGISMEQADALLKDDTMSQLKKGGMSKKEITALMNGGAKESNKKQGDWQDSQAQRRAENEAKWENTKKAGGSPLDKAWNGMFEGFLSQPQWAQWSEMGAGALGGGWLGSKAIGGLARKFAPTVGSRAGGGLLSRAGGALKGLGKGAGRLLGPVGELMAFKGIDDMNNGIWDWALGHKKGMEKSEGLFSNPFNGNQAGTYKDNRQGALSKAWHGVTEFFGGSKASAAELTPAELRRERAERESKAKQEQILTKEKVNIDSRKSQTEHDKTTLDKEKKNIDEMKNLFGASSGSSSSTAGDSGGGGFFSGLWNGIKGLFGGLFGTNTASASGGGSVSAPTTLSGGSNGKKIYSYLTSQGLTPSAAAGIMGNLQQESGLDPTKPGGGLAQWIGDRQKNLQSYAKQNGLSPTSMEAQLGFLMKELKSGNYGSISKLNGMNTSDAAKYFEQHFEKAGIPMMSKRIDYANGFYNQYADKVVTSSSSKKGTTSTLNVKVSGGVDGLTNKNNDIVTQAIKNNLIKSNVQLAYEFRQGLGGLL